MAVLCLDYALFGIHGNIFYIVIDSCCKGCSISCGFLFILDLCKSNKEHLLGLRTKLANNERINISYIKAILPHTKNLKINLKLNFQFTYMSLLLMLAGYDYIQLHQNALKDPIMRVECFETKW